MAILTPEELAGRAAEIDWLLCDVDGVLTDGSLNYDGLGNERLRFHVRDGLGLQLARSAGIKVGVLSGRGSAALKRRAAELKLDAVLTGISDKRSAFDRFVERQHTAARRVAFIGDDLPDLVVLGRCGLSFAPADAVPEVRAVVHRVLETRGGEGVAREMVEILLKARGVWDEVFAPFTLEA